MLFDALSWMTPIKEPHKELFKHCRPDVAALNRAGRKQHRLKLRKEWKDRKDFKP